MLVCIQRHITQHTVNRAAHKSVRLKYTWCWSGSAWGSLQSVKTFGCSSLHRIFLQTNTATWWWTLNTQENFVYRRYSNKDKCIPSNICSHCRHKTLYRVESRSRAFSLDSSFSSCLHVFSCAYRPVGMLRCCPKPVIQRISQYQICFQYYMTQNFSLRVQLVNKDQRLKIYNISNIIKNIYENI